MEQPELVRKIRGGSDKHLRDIASMLQVSGEAIDRGYIEQWAQALGLDDAWQAVVSRLRGETP